VQLSEVPRVRLLRVRNVEEADAADDRHGAEFFPVLGRLLPQLVSNFSRAAMIGLRSRVFFGRHCRWHLRDQVGVFAEEDEMDVAVTLDLELGDLRRDPPNPATEISSPRLGRRVKLRQRVDRRGSGVLRVQIDDLALWIAECLESFSCTLQPLSESCAWAGAFAATAPSAGRSKVAATRTGRTS
jgi:hypothetical protein